MFGFGNKSDPPVAGAGTGNFASGSEQDRYASHFTGVGEVAADKMKEAASKAAHYKGEGAEQDRYGSHFGGLGLDAQRVEQAAQSIKNATNGGSTGWFGLGYDGLERARRIASGDGAEQDRYGSYFSQINGRQVRKNAHSIKETIKEATTGR